jgi:hypothetical protein
MIYCWPNRRRLKLCGINGFSLFEKDGIVYRSMDFNDTSILQILVPQCMRTSILQHCHTGMCGGHLGFKKTLEQVRRRAFWIGWRGDVKRFCRRCADCNTKNYRSLHLYKL